MACLISSKDYDLKMIETSKTFMKKNCLHLQGAQTFQTIYVGGRLRTIRNDAEYFEELRLDLSIQFDHLSTGAGVQAVGVQL